jgi:Lipopolysaccharide kinase (Kdo/WaaP) family
MIAAEQHGVRWELQTDFAPLLDQVLGDAGQVVKQSPVKRVTVHHINRRIFFKKCYLHQAVPLRPLKFFFKPSQARQEWDLAQRLQAMEIPIVRHVALGERWSWRGLRESFLITEGFDGKPLNEHADAHPKAVLSFVNQLHDRGVLQRDLHPGNILRNAATGEMRLVDLHGTVIKPALSPRERDANLAFLRIFLPIPVEPEIEKLSARLRKQYYAYRAGRCLKHNREFAPKNSGALQWRVRLPFLNPAVENILRYPDAFLSDRAEILKPGRATTVGKADGLVLKRYNIRVRKLQNLLKDLFRPSKARRAFLKSYHLELTGVPTARPIATADRRVARVLLRGYLLMEEIRGAAHLGEWRGDTRQAAIRTADLLAKLHNEGFSHRDLKETNILFDGEGRVFLIDLEGLDYLQTVAHPRAAADLSRLARAVEGIPRFSNVDRMAFLHRYCRQRGIRPRHLKS